MYGKTLIPGAVSLEGGTDTNSVSALMSALWAGT